jgi:uncharacterized beta-barrel protein YwiB (DUF1934 family)
MYLEFIKNIKTSAHQNTPLGKWINFSTNWKIIHKTYKEQGTVNSVVEYLPSMHKSLGSISNTAKQQKSTQLTIKKQIFKCPRDLNRYC